MSKPFFTPPGTPCKECDRPTRPSKWAPEKLPGSVQLKTQGMCGACFYHYSKREPSLEHGLTHKDPEVRWQAAQTRDFIADRRRRGIPAEGTLTHKEPA